MAARGAKMGQDRPRMVTKSQLALLSSRSAVVKNYDDSMRDTRIDSISCLNTSCA
jgi:hypothetical protein